MEPPRLDQPKRRSTTGLWIAVSLLGIGLAASLLLNLGLLAGLVASIGGSSSSSFAEDEYPKLTERWSFGDGDVKAVRIALNGVIMRESSSGLFGPARDKIGDVLQQIRAAANDPHVKAIIMEVNSPGGAVTPSDEIYAALMNFKASKKGRTVVVHMSDLAASGGYYVAAAGDWLIAEPTTVLGSIGVIMQAMNWKTLSEKIGLSAVTIKSGDNKDLLNPFNEVKPAQVALLQNLIDKMYDRFSGLVATSRNIDAEQLRTLADGRVFTADEALQHGLIDEVGYWDAAVRRVAKLLDEPSVKVVRYEHTPRFMDLLAGVRSPFPLNSIQESAVPRMLYLWRP
jgi:protease-4